MNRFMHYGANLLAAAGMAAGTLLGAAPATLALSQEDVIEQLRSIPVFSIVDSNDIFLIVEFQPEETGEAILVAPLFVTREDAEQYLSRVRSTDPDLPEDVRVVLAPLARFYAASVAQQEPENQFELYYVPSADERQAAVEVLQEQLERQGQDPSVADQFLGTPLFASCNNEGNCLSPFFFAYSDFQTFLGGLEEDNPRIAEGFAPGVVTLQGLINSMEEAESLDQLQIIPSPETRQEIQELQEAVEGEESAE